MCNQNEGCTLACPKIYRPICGSDGETYNSQCELDYKNCVAGEGAADVAAAHEGRCRRRSCPDVAADCPNEEGELDPVCGSDGVEYNSECEMRAANCEMNKAVVVQHRGPCSVIDTLPR